MCVYFQPLHLLVLRTGGGQPSLWNYRTSHRNAYKLHCSLTPSTHNTHTYHTECTLIYHRQNLSTITLNTSLTTESDWIVSIR